MRIEHTAIYVNDLEAAKDFFIRFFSGQANSGYHNQKTGFRSYFISFNGGCRLELMTRPELTESEKEPFQPGYAHLAFSTGSKDAVDRLTAQLQREGYPVVSGPRTTGDGYYESCIAAVEGVLIEITE